MAPQHPVRYFFLTSLLVLSMVGCTSTRHQTVDVRGAETEIRAVLDAQVNAWNNGDLEGFMQGYWNAPELRFASGGNVRLGWQTTLEGYQNGYPNRDAMGTLRFEDLDIRLLSVDAAYVFGRWQLSRNGDFADDSGLFTLVFKRYPDGWQVVHDHTSSAD